MTTRNANHMIKRSCQWREPTWQTNIMNSEKEILIDKSKDIENRNDIETVLVSFYQKAFADELIGRFFTEVVPLDLATHLPVITDFWETVILNKQVYRKNVMQIHQHIHQLSSIKKEHLDRWVEIFTITIGEHFTGEKASLMKQRAASIATLMDIKLNHDLINKT